MFSVALMDELIQATCFEVGRADLSLTRVTGAELGPPGPGEALFEVERFGFSANNVTYALLGEPCTTGTCSRPSRAGAASPPASTARC